MTAAGTRTVYGILLTLALLVAVASCTQTHVGRVQPGVDDARLFDAVVRAVIAQPGLATVRIDPRPLRATSDIEEPSTRSLAAVADSVVKNRAAVLRQLHIAAGDAVANAQSDSCAGVLVVPDTGAASATAHRGCPVTQITVGAVGLARIGAGRSSRSGVYDIDRRAVAGGYYGVRVVLTTLGPGGSVVTYSDYVAKQSERGWAIVAIVRLMAAD